MEISEQRLKQLEKAERKLQALVTGKVVIENGYFSSGFCQVKQGKNYFIDLMVD